jgi:hypothetical protein
MIEALVRKSLGCLAGDPDHVPVVLCGKHIVPEPRLDRRVGYDATLDGRGEFDRVHCDFRRIEGCKRHLRIERLVPLPR